MYLLGAQRGQASVNARWEPGFAFSFSFQLCCQNTFSLCISVAVERAL